ncbi:MAG: M48 family metallopeptidase [Planctomycetota bacterium]|nr:M48 family metallopeptidase [Planctomycetota bacterium]
MWELIRQNERRSLLLMGALGAFTVLVGAVLGAAIDPRNGLAAGAILALGIWFVLTLFAYFAADRAVLAMSGAREITHKEFPRLWNVVEEIALAAAVPRPRIYLINDTAPNAFAVGRTPRNAAVAVTTGLLQKLTRDELTGVIAHEFAHIRNRDTKFMIRAAVMVGTIALMCDFFLRYTWFGGGTRSRRSSDSKGGGAAQLVILLLALVLAILAPIIARMLYLCISRRREYLADACSVEFTRNPEGLASALEKISSDQEVLEVANRATSPLYIANPIKSHEERAKNIFSTHPPITERIAILRSLAVGATLNDYEKQYRLIAKEGRKGGLYKPADLQQASAERAQRKPPGTHADGNVPVWELPGAMSQKGPVKSPQDLHRRMEPLARILACGDVARGTLPPDAALAALFGGGLGTLMMACACGQKLPVPEQPGEIPCTRCGAKLPVSREAVEAIARAKAQAGKQGAQVQTPAQLGVGVPPPPPPPLVHRNAAGSPAAPARAAAHQPHRGRPARRTSLELRRPGCRWGRQGGRHQLRGTPRRRGALEDVPGPEAGSVTRREGTARLDAKPLGSGPASAAPADPAPAACDRSRACGLAQWHAARRSRRRRRPPRADPRRFRVRLRFQQADPGELQRQPDQVPQMRGAEDLLSGQRAVGIGFTAEAQRTQRGVGRKKRKGLVVHTPYFILLFLSAFSAPLR